MSYSTQAMAVLGTFLTIKSWHWLKIIFFHQKGKEQCVLGALFGIQGTPKDGCGLSSSPIAQRRAGFTVQPWAFWVKACSAHVPCYFGDPPHGARSCSFPLPTLPPSPLLQIGPFSCYWHPTREGSQAQALPANCSLWQGQSNSELGGHHWAWHLGPD